MDYQTKRTLVETIKKEIIEKYREGESHHGAAHEAAAKAHEEAAKAHDRAAKAHTDAQYQPPHASDSGTNPPSRERQRGEG